MLLLSVSCSDFDQEKQKKSVSSLSSEVKTFKKEFNAIKIDSISDLKLSTYEVERRIKQNYYSDTIDISFGQKMDDFRE